MGKQLQPFEGTGQVCVFSEGETVDAALDHLLHLVPTYIANCPNLAREAEASSQRARVEQPASVSERGKVNSNYCQGTDHFGEFQ